jgi:hypothetical protein
LRFSWPHISENKDPMNLVFELIRKLIPNMAEVMEDEGQIHYQKLPNLYSSAHIMSSNRGKRDRSALFNDTVNCKDYIESRVDKLMVLIGENQRPRRHAPMPLCSQQIPHGLVWDRTRASSMGTVYRILVRKPEGKRQL